MCHSVQIDRSYLKKIFWSNLSVEPSLQVLDILEYACGLKLGPALTLNQNLFFEMASNKDSVSVFDSIFSRIPSHLADISHFFLGLKFACFFVHILLEFSRRQV